MEEKKIYVNADKIKLAIRSGIPLSITTYTLPHNIEVYMNEVLTEFLTQIGQKQMVQYLTYCQNELTTNAKKANTKRIYFKEKGLDITNENDYKQGMQNFKKDTLDNINYYLKKQKEAGLYVKLVLQVKNNKIKMEVHNNSVLTVFEYKRIHDKLSRSQQYNSASEAISKILDESEGAGLGLVIMILMLKKIGVTEENFQVLCENGETISRIILPLSGENRKAVNIISDEFEKAIEDLPMFPENITKLNRILSNPDSTMQQIAMQISNDVTLTGELLKIVNSAAFALATPCINIADAVKMIGIRGIKNMLFSIGSVKAFAGVSGNSNDLWIHAYKTALYSYNLARNFCANDKNIIEDSYICGLLHDIGKIIFETAHPDFLKQLESICLDKGISSDTFERILSGMDHGEAGAKIAEKWNFPDVIVNAIRFHHSPEDAPKENRMLCYIVYLANFIVYFQMGEVDFYQIDPYVLELFKIPNKTQFTVISDKLKSAYEGQSNK